MTFEISAKCEGPCHEAIWRKGTWGEGMEGAKALRLEHGGCVQERAGTPTWLMQKDPVLEWWKTKS